MTPYQKRLALVLDAGGRLERRMKETGYGILWPHPVVVLLDANGMEVESVRRPTVEALVAAGYQVDETQ